MNQYNIAPKDRVISNFWLPVTIVYTFLSRAYTIIAKLFFLLKTFEIYQFFVI